MPVISINGILEVFSFSVSHYYLFIFVFVGGGIDVKEEEEEKEEGSGGKDGNSEFDQSVPRTNYKNRLPDDDDVLLPTSTKSPMKPVTGYSLHPDIEIIVDSRTTPRVILKSSSNSYKMSINNRFMQVFYFFGTLLWSFFLLKL